MSLLIEDKDVPETCDNCDFHVYHSHGEYVCVATPMLYPMNLANSKGIRKDWCPLKEAPEPCEDVEEALRTLDAINSSGRLDYGDYCDLHDAISSIEIPEPHEIPSVQPEMRMVKDE